jgi:cell wall assembly regulator SMI1
MPDLLKRLDAWLSKNRPAYYAGLLPGLSDMEWDAFVVQLGVRPPDAFRAFYQWRSGNTNGCFHKNRDWMTAEDVADTKQMLDDMIENDFEPGYWNRDWIPFLHNGGGSYLCVDVTGATDDGVPGQLVAFWKADEDRPICAQSLEGWLADFVNSLERDSWEETQYGFECVKAGGK